VLLQDVMLMLCSNSIFDGASVGLMPPSRYNAMTNKAFDINLDSVPKTAMPKATMSKLLRKPITIMFTPFD
jgi:hypothetical protein